MRPANCGAAPIRRAGRQRRAGMPRQNPRSRFVLPRMFFNFSSSWGTTGYDSQSLSVARP